MNQQQYDNMTRRFRGNPRAAQALSSVNRALTALGYVAFPLLLIAEALAGSWEMVARTVLTAGIAFVSLSAFRHIVNVPRPYEALDIEPLIKSDSRGKSFPSRHTFSMFMIAFCWLAWSVPVGVLLTISGIALAATRVLGGVHWPRDVVAALAWAVAFAIVGFIAVP